MDMDDTHPAARAHQVVLTRAAGAARRFGVARWLTRAVGALSPRALNRRHPGATDVDLDRAFVESRGAGAEAAGRASGGGTDLLAGADAGCRSVSAAELALTGVLDQAIDER